MISGLNLPTLAATIKDQAMRRRDFLADSSTLVFCDDGAHLQMAVGGQDRHFRLRPHAHGQFADYTGIPKAYYDRMRIQAPELLAWNANLWLSREAKPRLVRTMDAAPGEAIPDLRAFLSNGYRPLDNADLFEHLMPEVVGQGMEVMSSQVTETRLYIQARFPKIQAEVKVGDVVQSGVIIQNSEVGAGSIAIEPFSYRLVCSNGMVHKSAGMRRSHVGARSQLTGQNVEYFRDETKRATDKAFWLQCRDTLHACVNEAAFGKIVDQMRVAAGIAIGKPADAVELVAARYAFQEHEKDSILNHLAAGGDMSLWGLANAITRTAEDSKDYDRAIELESLGGQAIELPANTFAGAN